MADLKDTQLRDTYDQVLTKKAGGLIADGDDVTYFDPATKANLAGGNSFTGLQRLVNGLNFNASGGDTLSDYELINWDPVYTPDSGSFDTLVMNVQHANALIFSGWCFLTADIRTSNLSKGAVGGGTIVRITGVPEPPLPLRFGGGLAGVGLLGAWATSPTSCYIGAGGGIVLNTRSTITGAEANLTVDAFQESTSNRNYIQLFIGYRI